MQEKTFWSGRPSPERALVTTLLVAALGGALALVATRVSSFSVRSHLELSGAGTDEFFLTPLTHDPARVQVTTRRENSTWTRDQASMAGDSYWVRRYGDPGRPGLPQRILLTSRSRGAHLFVPLGALDLERDLAELVSAEAPAEGQPFLRCSMSQVFWSRSFAGLFLHLRFPERPLRTEGPEAGKEIDFDLLIVRGNQLLTTDFLLQPNAEFYRALLSDGLMPPGPYRRNARCDELVQVLRTEPADTGVPLYSPISLFDELRLCWGPKLPHVVDDRWRPEEAPEYAVQPPSPETRKRLGRLGTQHLAARFEDEGERASLARALATFSGS
jgi:hypothetical protein